jgi:hypothetical protein
VLVMATEKTAAVSCGKCGRLFGKDESGWASDWKVCDAPDWKWRWETRYTCDDCEATS